MKKALLILLTLLTALIIMVSCDNSVDYPFDDDVPAVETPEMVPLTFEFIKDGKIIITNKPDNMVYSRNSGAKQPVEGEIRAEAGDRIKFYATRTSVEADKYLNINCTGDCYIYGNVMSLIKEEGFADKKDVFDYAFFNLFFENTHIRSHSSKKLVLPATTLAKGCYNSMFEKCTGLTIAPDLPAEALATSCYFNMFGGCSNLKTAPVISAINLADNCCSAMFRDCTSLTTAPALPATTLAESCYSSMFEGCTSLTSAPELKATTLAATCYQSMFKGCTSLTTAPELNATTLEEKCYEYMFYGCSSLDYIKCLATNPDSNYTNSWVEGVATEGLFEKADGIIWVYSNDGIPLNWCTDPKYIPLTLEFIQPGTVTIKNYPGSLKYTRNEGEKLSATDTIDVKAGDRIRFYADRIDKDNLNINCDANCYIYGNVMSLINENDFANTDSVFDYAFNCLFENNKCIKNHAFKQLVLPATNLAHGCYRCMFKYCSNLTDAPVLLATNLAPACYYSMFYGCTSLNTVQSIFPATTMKNDCYSEMFVECTGITKAPDLPATTLANNCYYFMFSGCTNLSKAPDLPAFEMKRECYGYMFQNCTSLTTAPALPATTLAHYCYGGMFKGCSSLTTAPALPATTLASRCYQEMFSGCKSLTTAPELPATTAENYCYYYMFSGCTSLLDAPVLPATSLKWHCYSNMFKGCSSLTTAPALLPATDLAPNCYESMFDTCISLTTAPALPATYLWESCYKKMFYCCENLSSITCLATDISGYECTKDWVLGVSSSGTFTKASTMNDWTEGSNGIPSGWTVINQ